MRIANVNYSTRHFAHAVRPFVATSVLALAATGCQPSNEPTQQDYNDVATSVGSLVAGGGGELTSIQDSVGTAQGEIPAGFSSSGSGQFEGTRGGLSYSYEVTCTGADGVTMAACDATTDSASLIVDWSGNYDGDYWQFEISRTGEWNVTGLQSDVAVFTGSGTFDVSSTSQSLDGQRDRSFDLSYAASYDIQWDMVAERVIEGTIDYAVHAERHVDGAAADRDAVFDISAEVIFDGSSTARLVLDGSHSYDIDINTGFVAAAQ
jgi:hypothetical protein